MCWPRVGRALRSNAKAHHPRQWFRGTDSWTVGLRQSFALLVPNLLRDFRLLGGREAEVEPVQVVAVGDLQEHSVLALRELHRDLVRLRRRGLRVARGEHLL